MYEIKLPEQIELQELTMVAARFNSLLKNFAKFNAVEDNSGLSNNSIVSKKYGTFEGQTRGKYDKYQYQYLRENRNAFVELLNTYYNKTPEEFELFKTQHNLSLDRKSMASIHIIKLKELHNVHPHEVGLIKFPSKGENRK